MARKSQLTMYRDLVKCDRVLAGDRPGHKRQKSTGMDIGLTLKVKITNPLPKSRSTRKVTLGSGKIPPACLSLTTVRPRSQ
jgi:hypothetical protein